ncbi:MAG: chromosome segregation protein SMC [Methanomicrobiales archaeon]
MYITHLEIDNFKSFSRKTKIPFFEGFTVVSGPNGSGKSNIIDAVLFVLALSGARGLRAERLTDLINVNTGKNTAEVAITFSDETEIRRRIKRTRNGYYSYYYLNNRLCKQSDVLDYLSRFGIKPEGYNVVMQGDITRIMEMSDLERRRIVDEIAGVAEFDAKREKALGELEVVRERIEREEILLHELTGRAEALQAERTQALKYRELREKIDELQQSRTVALLHETVRERDQMARILADHRTSREECEERQSAVNAEIAQKRERLADLDREIQKRSGDEYLRLIRRIEEEKSAIKSAEKEIERLKAEKDELSEAHTRAYMDARRAGERVDQLSGQIQSLTVDRSGLAMEQAEHQSRMDQLEADLDEASKESEGVKEELFSLMEEIDRLKGERSELLHRQDVLIEKSRLRTSERSRIEEKIGRLEEEQTRIQEALEEYRRQREECTTRKEKLERRISDTESRLFEHRNEAERLAGSIRSIEREIMQLEAQQQASGGLGGKALEAILGMEGVYGTIAQLGRVPPDYATALNTAAGGRLGWVVVADDRVAEDAIGYLKEHRLGRVTFLPLNKIQPPSVPALTDSSVIGRAIDLLEFDSRYDPAFRMVFGGTVVVESLAVARKKMGTYRMVTLEGDLVEKRGAMTGGSASKKASRGFGMAVEDDLARLRSESASLQAEAEDVRAGVDRLTGEADSLRAERQACEDELSRYALLEDEQNRREEEIAVELRSQNEALQTMQQEFAQSSGELASIEEDLEALGRALSTTTEKMDGLKKQLDNTRIPALTHDLERTRRERDDVERRLRQKEADIADAQREHQYFRNRQEEIEADRARMVEKEQSITTGIRAAEDRIEASRTAITELEARQEEFSRDLQALRDERDRSMKEIHDTESVLVEIQGSLERIDLQIETASTRLDELDAEIRAFPEEIHGSDCAMSLEEIDRAIGEAQAALDRLGAVNMLAVEEYDRVCARVAERTERKDTLSRERTNLIERIERFEQMKHDAFMQAFEAIDANFREIFATLTSGSGHLVLECEDDPFAGGLTFAVKPRDKKVHLLSSLSGGEKSLTTLAFIFSIQQFMPAPFYALDEVDMFLDGSNVERIADMIKDLSSNAQSVIVSLRRPMIERADRIIGVTLRGDKSTYLTGVSVHE